MNRAGYIPGQLCSPHEEFVLGPVGRQLGDFAARVDGLVEGLGVGVFGLAGGSVARRQISQGLGELTFVALGVEHVLDDFGHDGRHFRNWAKFD